MGPHPATGLRQESPGAPINTKTALELVPIKWRGNTHTHVHPHAHMHTHTHTHMHACSHTCTQAGTHARTHTQVSLEPKWLRMTHTHTVHRTQVMQYSTGVPVQKQTPPACRCTNKFHRLAGAKAKLCRCQMAHKRRHAGDFSYDPTRRVGPGPTTASTYNPQVPRNAIRRIIQGCVKSCLWHKVECCFPQFVAQR